MYYDVVDRWFDAVWPWVMVYLCLIFPFFLGTAIAATLTYVHPAIALLAMFVLPGVPVSIGVTRSIRRMLSNERARRIEQLEQELLPRSKR